MTDKKPSQPIDKKLYEEVRKKFQLGKEEKKNQFASEIITNEQFAKAKENFNNLLAQFTTDIESDIKAGVMPDNVEPIQTRLAVLAFLRDNFSNNISHELLNRINAVFDESNNPDRSHHL